VWCFERDGRFVGFAATINAPNLMMIDYLAVDRRQQGQGIGSQILQWFKQHYPDQGLFVEIESEFEAAPDSVQRKRRKLFYQRSGFMPSRVMAMVFGVPMELMCWNCCVSFEQYHALYHESYSPQAAKHIVKAEYPKA